MIADWRTVLGAPALPFVVQQLHAWVHDVQPGGTPPPGDFGLALFRAMQAEVAATVPGVGLSAAFDGGDPAAVMAPPGSPGFAPSGTVHPHCKYIPGRRLARSVLGTAYGPTPPVAVPFAYPTYSYAVGRAATINNGTASNISVTVHFAAGTTGSGLALAPYDPTSNSSHCPTERGVNASYCDWFSVQVNDAYPGTWYNASVAVGSDGATLVLTVTVPRPGLAAAATRNGYSDWPVTTVYTHEGLPVMPWLKPLTP
jgi:hypothetical protein